MQSLTANWTPIYYVEGARIIGKLEFREVDNDRLGRSLVWGAWWYRNGEASHAIGADFDSFAEAKDWLEAFEAAHPADPPGMPIVDRTSAIIGITGACLLFIGGLLLWIQI